MLLIFSINKAYFYFLARSYSEFPPKLPKNKAASTFIDMFFYKTGKTKIIKSSFLILFYLNNKCKPEAQSHYISILTETIINKVTMKIF